MRLSKPARNCWLSVTLPWLCWAINCTWVSMAELSIFSPFTVTKVCAEADATKAAIKMAAVKVFFMRNLSFVNQTILADSKP